MIPVLAVIGSKLAAAQVAERKVLDAPKIALTSSDIMRVCIITDQQIRGAPGSTGASAIREPRRSRLRDASYAVGNLRVHEFHARSVSVKCGEAIFCEASGFDAVGGWPDHDFPSAPGARRRQANSR